MSLIYPVYRDPGEEATNDEAPDCVASPGVGIKVEKLHSAALVVFVPDLVSSAHIKVSLDDDREEADEHAGGLEHISPYHGLDAANGRVETADSENQEAGDVEVKAGDLKSRWNEEESGNVKGGFS